MPAALKVAVVSTALGLPKVTVPGPLTLLQVTRRGAGWVGQAVVGDGAVQVRPRRAGSRSGPVLRTPTGGWLLGGAPLVYSTWSSGAKLPSNASAVRRPLPVTCTARALPRTHPGRLTTAWTSEERSGVCWAAVLAPAVLHAGGLQATDAVVTARLLRLLLVPG